MSRATLIRTLVLSAAVCAGALTPMRCLGEDSNQPPAKVTREVPPELLAPPRPPIDVDTVRAAAEAEGLRRLRALIPADAKAFCTVETAVTEGAADHAILLACQARHADLVVMGVNRHRRLDRLIFGSTAARVTRAASCPVLLVPQRANTPGGD